MSKKTIQKVKAALTTLFTAKKTSKQDSSNEQFYNEKVLNTPFRVVGEKGKGYRLIFGTEAIGELRPTPEQAMLELETDTWNIIARVAGVVYIHQRKDEIERTREYVQKAQENQKEAQRQGKLLKQMEQAKKEKN